MLGVYTVSTYFYYTKAILMRRKTETTHVQLLHSVTTIQVR